MDYRSLQASWSYRLRPIFKEEEGGKEGRGGRKEKGRLGKKGRDGEEEKGGERGKKEGGGKRRRRGHSLSWLKSSSSRSGSITNQSPWCSASLPLSNSKNWEQCLCLPDRAVAAEITYGNRHRPLPQDFTVTPHRCP